MQGAFAQHCASCHGADGKGNQQLGAPSLAGRPKWFLESQIRHFHLDLRGTHPKDTSGKLMHDAVAALPVEVIEQAVEEVSSMQPLLPTLMGKHDVAHGAELYRENCMECHRFNGRGELTFGSSPLTGQHAWYLRTQLDKFRTGQRGYAPTDVHGHKMRKVMEQPLSSQDLDDIVAYIISLNDRYPPK